MFFTRRLDPISLGEWRPRIEGGLKPLYADASLESQVEESGDPESKGTETKTFNPAPRWTKSESGDPESKGTETLIFCGWSVKIGGGGVPPKKKGVDELNGLEER